MTECENIYRTLLLHMDLRYFGINLDNFISHCNSILNSELVKYYLSQNPSFPLIYNFENYFHLIVYNRFSKNKNFPKDKKIIDKLINLNKICWIDFYHNKYISDDLKQFYKSHCPDYIVL